MTEMTRAPWLLHCLARHIFKRGSIHVARYALPGLGIPVEERHTCTCGRYWIRSRP